MSSNDNKPSPLIEWLNRLWLPVTGFIGAVVVIVQFVELWKGNKGLVTWVIISLGYLALLSAIGYFAFAKEQSPIDPSRRISIYPSPVPKYAKTTFVTVILMTIIALGILLGKPALTIMSNPSTRNSVSTLAPECKDVEVYLELNNLLTGNKQIGCSPDDNRIVILSDKDIGGLVNLTGRISGSVIANSNVCDWGWFIKINTRPNPLSENCSFSININDLNTEKIFIENTDQSILFTIQIQR